MAVPALTELRRRRTEIIQVAEARGAHHVRVFGSVARGDSSGTSDVDFLVDLHDGRGLFDLGGLLMDLRDLLGCDVDVATAAWPATACRRAHARGRRGPLRPDRDRLLDMIEMCDLLLEHAAEPDRLGTDPVLQAAAQRWIEILGEAATKLSDELKQAHVEVLVTLDNEG